MVIESSKLSMKMAFPSFMKQRISDRISCILEDANKANANIYTRKRSSVECITSRD